VSQGLDDLEAEDGPQQDQQEGEVGQDQDPGASQPGHMVGQAEDNQQRVQHVLDRRHMPDQLVLQGQQLVADQPGHSHYRQHVGPGLIVEYAEGVEGHDQNPQQALDQEEGLVPVCQVVDQQGCV
jgi:hypothetical protein